MTLERGNGITNRELVVKKKCLAKIAFQV